MEPEEEEEDRDSKETRLTLMEEVPTSVPDALSTALCVLFS